MELLVISGVSGAGKSVAMNALEDIGFFCIDNIPAALLPSVALFSHRLGEQPKAKIAISMDIRGCSSAEEVSGALSELKKEGIEFRVLFLNAEDEVLRRRYKETRRRHPMSIALGLTIEDALCREREILRPLYDAADYRIDTSLLNTSQNKERICELFNQSGGAKGAMQLTILSFGFKFGLPREADLVLDVRCLPNPFYIPELKAKTGLDREVFDFVMSCPPSKELLSKYEDFLRTALPLYVKEGKSQLTVAVGCTGGKHRSISFACAIADFCRELGYLPAVQHRDEKR